MAVGELGLSLMQYYDRTLFELSIEIEGYNARWEEQWRHTRKLYTLLYNTNAKKGQGKKEHELIKLPSDFEALKSIDKFAQMKEGLRLEHNVKKGL